MEEEIKKIESFLEKYNNFVGLDKLQITNKTTHYINLNDEDLVKLTSRECAEASLLLTRHSLFVQKELNRDTALAKWCFAHIDYMIAPIIKSCNSGDTYMPYKYRRCIAIAGNDITKKLDSLLRKFRLRIGNLKGIQDKLEKLAEKYDRLAYFKKEQ